VVLVELVERVVFLNLTDYPVPVAVVAFPVHADRH
jgi:hypothetical protein